MRCCGGPGMIRQLDCSWCCSKIFPIRILKAQESDIAGHRAGSPGGQFQVSVFAGFLFWSRMYCKVHNRLLLPYSAFARRITELGISSDSFTWKSSDISTDFKLILCTQWKLKSQFHGFQGMKWLSSVQIWVYGWLLQKCCGLDLSVFPFCLWREYCLCFVIIH